MQPQQQKRQTVDSDDDDDNAGSDTSGSVSDSTDTETEIAQRQTEKSRKTLKRKRRATSPSRFGAALESLLSTSGPPGVPAPLSLKPGVVRRHKEEKLERGARKVLEGEKKEREEKGRVRDVIGGWGAEGERALRKVAQRGVITLFNTIQQSQANTEQTSSAAKALRGTGKARLPAPDADRNDKMKKTKSGRLDEGSFMDMIRAGRVVSKR